MQHAHIDSSRGLDGEPVVLACFDLREDEIAAACHAVTAIATERYRTARMSADEVLELRELTAITDELEHGLPAADTARGIDPDQGIEQGPGMEAESGIGPGPGSGIGPGPRIEPAPGMEPAPLIRTLVFQPARLSVLRDAIAAFVESRDEAEWIRKEDREALALLRRLLLPLEQLCADALRAALSPESHVG
jgi:hypothetical protein